MRNCNFLNTYPKHKFKLKCNKSHILSLPGGNTGKEVTALVANIDNQAGRELTWKQNLTSEKQNVICITEENRR